MKIKYENSIDETIDCLVRLYWLRKSSKRKLVIHLIIIPVICFSFLALEDFQIREAIFQCVFFTIFFGIYLIYAYTKGHRKNIRKVILESLNGEPFPEEIEYDINEDGVVVKTKINEMKFPWSSIKDIRPYKQYIELVGSGNLVQIQSKYVSDINDIIQLWKNSNKE